MTYLLSEPRAADPSASGPLTIWANWSQIIGAGAAVVLAVWAIAIATRQLNDARRSALGQFILGIDEAFRSYEDVRRYFNQPSKFPKPEKSELYRYIAVFEPLGLLIKWKLLTPKDVDMLYGHRFEKPISYDLGRFKADFGDFPPEARPQAWGGFIELWHALKNRRKVGEPPPKRSIRKEEDDPELPPGPASFLG